MTLKDFEKIVKKSFVFTVFEDIGDLNEAPVVRSGNIKILDSKYLYRKIIDCMILKNEIFVFIEGE